MTTVRQLLSKTRSELDRTMGRMVDQVAALKEPAHPIARIAINHAPKLSSWGGGNQWVTQMTRHLRRQGYAVRFDLRSPVDAIVIVDPRLSDTVSFGVDAIQEYKRTHPNVQVIHRVNENDQRKGTAFMDRLLSEANQIADFTIFISEWLQEYHAARWFDRTRPHQVIVNGADTQAFNPVGSVEWNGREPFRLVTHHWSDNPLKGFDVYEALDRLVASGTLKGVKLVMVGRWPKSIRWKSAECHGPVNGTKLARLLRNCHGYVTASRWEPGGMHFIEGAQCGLPVLYHEEGGGIVEVARRFGIGFSDDGATALRQLMARYGELRAAVLSDPPSGFRMCEAYTDAISKLLCAKAKS